MTSVWFLWLPRSINSSKMYLFIYKYVLLHSTHVASNYFFVLNPHSTRSDQPVQIILNVYRENVKRLRKYSWCTLSQSFCCGHMHSVHSEWKIDFKFVPNIWKNK